jgi:EAL domain-containing protein (putative c-di-GMP-specific phosphodiesterase class I)
VTDRSAQVPDLSVLVIDDQEDVRRYVRRVLSSAGITQVTEAANGREALAAVTAPGAAFQLVLCDLRMPDRDGIETIRALAALGLEAGIIITSVEEERIIESAGMLAEVQGLRLLGTVPKPLTAQKLVPLLEGLRRARPEPAAATAAAPPGEIPAAIARDELQFQYQPKVTLATGRFSGVEALVRWKHPSLGVFLPGAFVPFVEQSDELSAELAWWSLRQAMACAGRWARRGWQLPMAVNLSARVFDQLDLPDRIEKMALAEDLTPGLITLELTETQVAREETRMIDVATRLRLKGFRLSIDDFGTGQSGLSKLQRLPFTELKIDRQFVHGCAASSSQRSVVEASLSLARSLHMASVAEGVQDRADWDLLQSLGCDLVQGFYIARPMSEEGLVAWVEQRAARPATA